MSTIPAALRAAAGRFATDAAVVDGSDTLTFGELAEQAETVAGALVRAGVEPGDRVALWAPNSLRWVVASLGVYMSGAVLVPINTALRAQEAQHVLTTSRARLVLTVDDFPEADFVGMLRTMADLEHQTVALLSGDSDGRWPSWEAFLDLATDVDRERRQSPRSVARRRVHLRHHLHVRYDGRTEGGDADPRRQRAHLRGLVGGGRLRAWRPVSLCVSRFSTRPASSRRSWLRSSGAPPLIPHAVFDVPW